MKRLIVSILILGTSLIAVSQNSPIDKFFDKYSGKEGYTSVFISKYMFNMFSSIDPEDKELQQIFSGLSSIKILATQTPAIGINFHKEVMKELQEKDYKELMIIKEKDQDIKFMVKENQGKIVELLLISGGKDNVLISIQGENINLKNISNLSKSMKIEGLENLEKIEN